MLLASLLLPLFVTGSFPSKPEDSAFGEPLFVDGKRVRDEEIEFALLYGPCRLKIENLVTRVILEDEIVRETREHPGFDPAARCRVDDAEAEAEYQFQARDFHERFPTLDLETELRRSFRSVALYREHLRLQQCFDRLFLPDDPADWPTTTIEAVKADPGGGALLLTEAKEDYATRRKAAEKNGGAIEREDDLYLTFLREIVRDAVLATITVKRHEDGLDAGLALWVDVDGDGKPELSATLEELWKSVRETVTQVEIAEAKQLFITSIATRDRLARDGALLTKEEERQALAELVEPGYGPRQVEQTATSTYFFPSLESFEEYHVLRKGFERMLAPRLADGPKGELAPALAQYLPRANRILGLGMVESEVLLVSALDIPRFEWKPDGWQSAWQKALAVRAEYARAPTPDNWKRLVDAHSEYWDPPDPQPQARHNRTVCRDYKKKGRFGPRYRSELFAFVGETACTEWATGECITDRIFFEQEVGTVAGPFRGPLGWYLTYLKSRTEPTRPLDLSNPRHRQALREDYLRHAFIEYSKEAVARAEIRGWTPL